MRDVMTAQLPDGTRFGIELLDAGTPEGQPAPGGSERLTSPTGLRERARDGVSSLGGLLTHIAAAISAEIEAMDPARRPAEIEAEVCLGMSAQAGPVWLSAGGECTLRAKLTWKS